VEMEAHQLALLGMVVLVFRQALLVLLLLVAVVVAVAQNQRLPVRVVLVVVETGL